ncbi:tail fiber protein [bacterium]|nr:tail fiber protein [bacterium]
MALTKIEYGALASSQVMNNNFDYLDGRITTVSQNMSSATSGIYSNIASINALITATSDKLRPIGQPIIRLSDTLFEDEIRLEGDAVSRVTYSALFEIYGVTYGAGDGINTFNLPDFRNRVLWGSGEFGYLDAELPNIKGSIDALCTYKNTDNWTGAFKSTSSFTWRKAGVDQTLYDSDMTFDASESSEIYKDEGTVRPPAIQVRVVTRFR